jgi:glutaredoxin
MTEKETSNETTEKKVSRFSKMNKWMIVSLILAITLIGAVIYFNSGVTGMTVAGSLTPTEAAEKAVKFINGNLVETGTASLISAGEYKDMYSFNFSYQGKNFTFYLTKDGSNMFLASPLDITKELPKAEEQTQQPTEVQKTDKPSVQLFVMAFCPYGIQAENAMKPVVDLLGSKASIEPHFIVNAFSNENEITKYVEDIKKNNPQSSITVEQVKANSLKLTIDGKDAYINSLHGGYEAKEDIRQACIWKNYGQAIFWTYVNYINSNCNKNNIDTCWKDAANTAKITTSEIESCVTNEGLILMKNEEALSNQNQVSGSPTLLINGVTYSGARTSDAYKDGICNAFTTEPSECSKTLSSSASAASGGCAT